MNDGLRLPRIEIEEADPDMVRTLAVHCLREAAEHLAIGNVTQGKTLTEAALVWMDGWA